MVEAITVTSINRDSIAYKTFPFAGGHAVNGVFAGYTIIEWIR